MLPFLNTPENNMGKNESTEGVRAYTIAEQLESQRKGHEGIGLNEKSYNEDQADFNQGHGDCPK